MRFSRELVVVLEEIPADAVKPIRDQRDRVGRVPDFRKSSRRTASDREKNTSLCTTLHGRPARVDLE